MNRSALVAALCACFVLAAPAREREFAMPPLVPATSIAAHDAHPDEKLTFAAEPYDTPQKVSIFHPALLEHDVLPIRVLFTNDADTPVLLANARFQLVTRDRAKAEPYSIDDLRRVLTHLRAPGSRAQDTMPIPLPGKNKAHGGLSSADVEQLQRAFFRVTAIDPHSTQQGFLFFDVTGLDNPAQGARLFLTGVTDSHAHELMYFEVPLDAPRNVPPAAQP